MTFLHRYASIALLLAATLPSAKAAPPSIGGCQILPANNYWNTPVDTLPVHANSTMWINSMGATTRLHADWGNKLNDGGVPPINEIVEYGIPYTTVAAPLPSSTVTFAYDDESDPGPYPVPTTATVEGGPTSDGDRHVLTIDTVNCVLYELYRAFPAGPTAWTADSGARWPLNSNASRPVGWTSADAAGLAILPGLVKWEEVQAGEINHAIRFTAASIYGRELTTGLRQYIWPARHWSGNGTDATRPPMGVRVRLKASFNISGFDSRTQVILRAMKKYGMVLADGGSNWYFSGMSNVNWPDIVIQQLNGGLIRGGDFEAVDTLPLQIDPNSEQAVQPPSAPLNLVTTPGDGQVQFTFSAPADNGGKPIIDYAAICGATTVVSTTSPITITGLNNNIDYACEVRARNAVFQGEAANSGFFRPGIGRLEPASSFVFANTTVVGFPIQIGGRTLSNQGNKPTSPLTVTLSGPGAADFQILDDFCTGASLNPLSSCTLSFGFAPQTFGPKTATVTVSGATTIPATLTLSGTATAVPGAPTLLSLTPGDGEVSAHFLPPSTSGSSPIISYALKCMGTGFTGFSFGTTAILSFLPNETTQTCWVVAHSLVGDSLPSNSLTVFVSAMAPLAVMNARSRRLHGPASNYDILVFPAPGAAPTVEPRLSGATQTYVFRLNKPLVNPAIVVQTLDEGGQPIGINGANQPFLTNDREIQVTLSDLPEKQPITFRLSDAASGLDFSTRIVLLPGDVNGSGLVSAADIAATKARVLLNTINGNYEFDINRSYAVDATDVSLVKSRSGTKSP